MEARVSISGGTSEASAPNRENSEPAQSLASKLRARSIDQFCQCFGIGRTTAYEQIKLGRLRARKVGKRTIIADDDAEEWLRNLPQVETKR
ncbi:helix-turn-helix domain-containing protein [Bradyrhizobium sp. AUGA SZCCT0182]|uniref:helix-turn-helix domain-containing protein n=1 Tax=Bradyrhizobium sp. AUGA SZCCT0182 TaxID=2807667 RepID=UPI001BA69646|nr:helix-turn-helix domain-containing protein [Bradyrhizobium sp. AUGA SZCCT0182]MBR1233668.1 helix-turn-helix domain-containing protein [Bradyrhizobium sp. AUGA SZCCT0182]